MKEKVFWENAYRKNAPVLRGVVRRYIPDNEIVQDLVHEVFITAINKYENYTEKGNFDAWLYRIAVNTSLMHLRSKKPQELFTDLTIVERDDEDVREEDSEDARSIIESAAFTTDELLNAIDKLPYHHKVVFNMYVIDNYSHKQISEELNISAGTSKSHLARARKKIQQYLYDEALSKKKAKRAMVFLAFPAKGHFIDKLFHSNFSGFTVPGSPDISFISSALAQHAIPAASTASQTLASSGFWTTKLAYIGTGFVSAVVMTTVGWFAFAEPEQEKTPIENVKEIPVLIISDTIYERVGDTTSLISFKDSVKLMENDSSKTQPVVQPREKEKKKEKVVIKRQIIERRTVIVRDTVIIKE